MADITQSLEKITKLPKAQKLMLLVGIVVLIPVAYYYAYHKAAQELLQTKRDEITKLQAQYNEQQKILANLPKFRKELKTLQAKFESSLKLLPNSREIPSLLKNISTLANECGLDIALFQPKPELRKSFYAEIPVEMVVTGKYHDLGYFFDKVSKLPRIVNISEISLKAKKQKKTGPQVGNLNSSFKATTFKFIEKDSDSGKNKRRRRRR